MDAATLKDMAIVSVTGATRLGTVNEVLFETEPLRVSALRGTSDEGEFTLSIDRISRFGPDAVMVENPEVKELARGAGRNERTLEELTHIKVVDEDGRNLGTVRRVEFDPDSGRVEQIVTGEGGTLGIGGMKATIRAAGIRGVGTDLMTVASSETAQASRADADADPTGTPERDAGAPEGSRAE